MSPPLLPTALALLLALASPPASAQVLQVGPPGSGAAYADIQPAIDAAPPGATVLVAPGAYGPVVLTKPLSVVGSGSGLSRIVQPKPGAHAVHIEGLQQGAGEALVVGFEVVGPPSSCIGACAAVVWVGNNSGPVTLADLTVDASLHGPARGIGLYVTGCRAVDVLDSRFAGHDHDSNSIALPAVLVLGSSVTIAESSLRGGSGLANTAYHWAQPALHMVDSSVLVAQSELHGGDGGVATFGGINNLPGAPAVITSGGDLRLAGGPGFLLQAGDAGSDAAGGCFDGAPAVSLTGDLHGGAGLALVGGAPPSPPTSCAGSSVGPPILDLLGGTITLDPWAWPTLAGAPVAASPGQSVALALGGEPLALQLVFWSADLTAPFALPPYANLVELDPATLQLVGAATLDAQGAAGVTVPLPASATLTGLDVHLQSAQVGAAPGLSNAWVLVID